ncbi:MAG TPA: DUF5711 family protein [Sedimentibacter sp.]|jgi:hypothetical protein|nr:hypothetical protein [Sedimentibacter sp.]HOW22898.1 DUF5711 family protein [Sedimentibacter sp.]HRC80761.1 DUF5711 family protein [Sedimentibacter sp.]
MKKALLFILIILILVMTVLYSPFFKDLFKTLDEKKIYKVENIKSIDFNTLEEVKFFGKGILTYNSQRIIYMDLNNNILWENQKAEFSNRVLVTDNNVFRQVNNKAIMLDKNNQEYIIAEIEGNIVNVSRENGKTCMIVMGNGQALYIIDENNDLVVDNKKFKDIITGISINDKSQAYALTTLNFEKGIPVNNLYYLVDDVELWSSSIANEILIKTKVVNNNVIVLGTDNLYLYNNNGKLMWKNSIYNKILDYYIAQDQISILFEKDRQNELITYNFEGKVMEIQPVPSETKKLKIVDNKILVHNDNIIYLLHNNKADKIFEDTERLEDLLLDGNNIYILFKNKIIRGQIK